MIVQPCHGAAPVYPAYPFHMSARDLARFAMLYPNDGKWRDRQIPPDRLASSTPRLRQIGRLLRLILDAAPPPDRL
jgi:hypothetical protein